MKCNECIHWEWPDNKMGLCTKTVRDVGRKGMVAVSDDGWEVVSSSEIYPYAGIYTGPEFGCVHYEKELDIE